MAWAVVVLAGGRARRLDGMDKPGLAVGGRTLLDVVLAACVGAEPVVVVGPRRVTARPVSWRREEPRYAGPAAALATGLAMVPDSAEFTAVLAADLPGLRPSTMARLLTAVAGEPADTGTGQRWGAPAAAVPADAATGTEPGPGTAARVDRPAPEVQPPAEALLPANRATSEEEVALGGAASVDRGALTEPGRDGDGRDRPVRQQGAVLVDGGGRRQWLCGVWRTVALRAAVAGLGDPTDRAVRAVLGGLAAVEVVAVGGEAVDVDTPGDLRALAAE